MKMSKKNYKEIEIVEYILEKITPIYWLKL